MSILKVWQLTLILAKQDPMGRGYTEKKAFLHSSDEKTWFLTFPLIFKWSKMRGFKKASLYVYFEGLTTDSYFGKAWLPGERSYREKGLFYTLLMRKHDFWPFHWFLNGQIWGLKKLLSMSILKVWQLTLILAKQDPVEGGHIEKRLFTLFWWENMISDLSIDFQMVTNGGFKKASLYVHYEGLTTDSYFGKTRLTGERSYRKMGIFTLFWWENMISDLSIDFQMVTKWGVKKASLYVHYEGLIPDSYFGKERLPGERSYRKRLFYTLLMRKHDFWPFHWFSNGQKWGV